MRRRDLRSLAAVVVAAGASLGTAACGTPAQVRWATYAPNFQATIDSATLTKDCATLTALDQLAHSTNQAHKKATGVSNRALESYLHGALREARC